MGRMSRRTSPSFAIGSVDPGPWRIIECERVLYVDRGRDNILCDRLPSPITIVVKVRQ